MSELENLLIQLIDEAKGFDSVKAAEQKLYELEIAERDFFPTLLRLAARPELDFGIRMGALLHVKVRIFVLFTAPSNPAIAEQHQHAIEAVKHVLLNILEHATADELPDFFMPTLTTLITHIAIYCWPAEWPDLIPTIARMLRAGSENTVKSEASLGSLLVDRAAHTLKKILKYVGRGIADVNQKQALMHTAIDVGPFAIRLTSQYARNLWGMYETIFPFLSELASTIDMNISESGSGGGSKLGTTTFLSEGLQALIQSVSESGLQFPTSLTPEHREEFVRAASLTKRMIKLLAYATMKGFPNSIQGAMQPSRLGFSTTTIDDETNAARKTAFSKFIRALHPLAWLLELLLDASSLASRVKQYQRAMMYGKTSPAYLSKRQNKADGLIVVLGDSNDSNATSSRQDNTSLAVASADTIDTIAEAWSRLVPSSVTVDVGKSYGYILGVFLHLQYEYPALVREHVIEHTHIFLSILQKTLPLLPNPILSSQFEASDEAEAVPPIIRTLVASDPLWQRVFVESPISIFGSTPSCDDALEQSQSIASTAFGFLASVCGGESGSRFGSRDDLSATDRQRIKSELLTTLMTPNVIEDLILTIAIGMLCPSPNELDEVIMNPVEYIVLDKGSIQQSSPDIIESSGALTTGLGSTSSATLAGAYGKGASTHELGSLGQLMSFASSARAEVLANTEMFGGESMDQAGKRGFNRSAVSKFGVESTIPDQPAEDRLRISAANCLVSLIQFAPETALPLLFALSGAVRSNNMEEYLARFQASEGSQNLDEAEQSLGLIQSGIYDALGAAVDVVTDVLEAPEKYDQAVAQEVMNFSFAQWYKDELGPTLAPLVESLMQTMSSSDGLCSPPSDFRADQEQVALSEQLYTPARIFRQHRAVRLVKSWSPWFSTLAQSQRSHLRGPTEEGETELYEQMLLSHSDLALLPALLCDLISVIRCDSAHHIVRMEAAQALEAFIQHYYTPLLRNSGNCFARVLEQAAAQGVQGCCPGAGLWGVSASHAASLSAALETQIQPEAIAQGPGHVAAPVLDAYLALLLSLIRTYLRIRAERSGSDEAFERIAMLETNQSVLLPEEEEEQYDDQLDGRSANSVMLVEEVRSLIAIMKSFLRTLGPAATEALFVLAYYIQPIWTLSVDTIAMIRVDLISLVECAINVVGAHGVGILRPTVTFLVRACFPAASKVDEIATYTPPCFTLSRAYAAAAHSINFRCTNAAARGFADLMTPALYPLNDIQACINALSNGQFLPSVEAQPTIREYTNQTPAAQLATSRGHKPPTRVSPSADYLVRPILGLWLTTLAALPSPHTFLERASSLRDVAAVELALDMMAFAEVCLPSLLAEDDIAEHADALLEILQKVILLASIPIRQTVNLVSTNGEIQPPLPESRRFSSQLLPSAYFADQEDAFATQDGAEGVDPSYSAFTSFAPLHSRSNLGEVAVHFDAPVEQAISILLEHFTQRNRRVWADLLSGLAIKLLALPCAMTVYKLTQMVTHNEEGKSSYSVDQVYASAAEGMRPRIVLLETLSLLATAYGADEFFTPVVLGSLLGSTLFLLHVSVSLKSIGGASANPALQTQPVLTQVVLPEIAPGDLSEAQLESLKETVRRVDQLIGAHLSCFGTLLSSAGAVDTLGVWYRLVSMAKAFGYESISGGDASTEGGFALLMNVVNRGLGNRHILDVGQFAATVLSKAAELSEVSVSGVRTCLGALDLICSVVGDLSPSTAAPTLCSALLCPKFAQNQRPQLQCAFALGAAQLARLDDVKVISNLMQELLQPFIAQIRGAKRGWMKARMAQLVSPAFHFVPVHLMKLLDEHPLNVQAAEALKSESPEVVAALSEAEQRDVTFAAAPIACVTEESPAARHARQVVTEASIASSPLLRAVLTIIGQVTQWV